MNAKDLGRTSAKMASALSMVAQGASPSVAADASGVSFRALYKAMRKYNLGGDRCPACKRLMRSRKGLENDYNAVKELA